MVGRSLLVMVVVAAEAVCLAGRISAEPLNAAGVIAGIDGRERTFSLESGQTFVAGPKVKLSTRRVGEEVRIRYEVTRDRLIAVSVKRMPVALQAPVLLPSRN